MPFYVCAPLSSVDLEMPVGAAIPIEERPAEEVLEYGGVRTSPPGATAWNPAFDVTPASLISAIVTEEGVLVAPFGAALRTAVEAKRARSAPPSLATDADIGADVAPSTAASAPQAAAS